MQYFGYLFAAYTIITLAILLFVFNMVQRQKGLSRDVETLKKAMEARESKKPGPKF